MSRNKNGGRMMAGGGANSPLLIQHEYENERKKEAPALTHIQNTPQTSTARAKAITVTIATNTATHSEHAAICFFIALFFLLKFIFMIVNR